MTVGTMEAALIKGNNRPGDVRRLVPNGVMVSIQIFIGYIETNPLWHVLNNFSSLGGLGPSPSAWPEDSITQQVN
jgi:hypothetical protein